MEPEDAAREMFEHMNSNHFEKKAFREYSRGCFVSASSCLTECITDYLREIKDGPLRNDVKICYIHRQEALAC